MSNPLLDLIVSISRDAANAVIAEQKYAAQQAEAAEALADQPEDWNPPLTEVEVNRYATEQAEIRSEGRTFPHRFNFKE